ncbi:hypothetical protein Scep_030618 [Stephania cephalantha]|uniref:CBS domain-containing protein n=1 Tax=Stephania cephalantha TaxID=152367 RepID=A0AAP0HGM8_9MAGN
MYSSGTDSIRASGAAAGAVLIPTTFVWPYGGRRVVGASTDVPVEGCPTVFQAICSLTPGYHEYKYFVDGEWRHDERQPFVASNYGIVNTILISREPDPIPAIFQEPESIPAAFGPETPGSRSNMDVDNDAFQRVVTLSDGSIQEVIPRISEADLQVSHHRISIFLSRHTAYELLPESGKVIALDVNLPVKQAFHILYEQGIPLAPLWDFCKGQFVGVLSPLDFILILRELGNNGSNLTEEELETHTISAWKESKLHLNRQTGRSTRAGPYDSLKDIALKILQNEVSVVPIIHSSYMDGSFPQLLHLASLSGILKCTWVPKIGESNGRPLAMLRPNASLSSALTLLVQAQVSSIPIVDDNDSLLDVYSRRLSSLHFCDITALAKDRAYAKIRLDEISVHQALQLGQDANSPFGFFNGQRFQMCLRSDPLHKIMERLSNPGVRRIIIVEAGSKRAEGIISLSDVFRFLLGCNACKNIDILRKFGLKLFRGNKEGSVRLCLTIVASYLFNVSGLSWSGFIAFVHCGCRGCLEVFQISNMWVDPEDQINPFVQVLALKACGHKAELVHGRLFHCYSVKTGFVNSVEVKQCWFINLTSDWDCCEVSS